MTGPGTRPRKRTAARRPGIVDCQCHLYPPELLALMECRRRDPVVYRRDGERYVRMGSWHRRVFRHHCDPDTLVARMNACGIAVSALSVNDPGPEWFGRDRAAAARTANDFVNSVVARHPGRFLGLGVLPLTDRSAAEHEFERCVGRLGMKGFILYTNLAGRFPDEPDFRWLFAAAAERNLPLLLHPAKPLTADLVADYEMIAAIGNMFENTVALTRIIFAGILDEFPRLKLVCPHLGGALPFLIGRLDHQVRVLKRGPGCLRQAPSEYLRRVWFDCVSPLPQAIRFAVDLLGPERLLFASDYPWVDPALILGTLRRLKLPRPDEEAILAGNACRLFGLGRELSRNRKDPF